MAKRLYCLCNWNGHDHDGNTCTNRIDKKTIWYDGKSYQLCNQCIDALEVQRILREVRIDSIRFMGTE